MRRIIAITVVLVMLISFCGCEKENTNIQPDIAQVQTICKLATLECYYHNVAKYDKSSGGGWWLWEEEDRKLWIEYSGVVKLGVDMSKVKMSINDDEVTITMPKATVLSIKVDEKVLNEDSYIASGDNSWNPNKITVDDQTKAIGLAQEEMKKIAENNTVLLLSAQTRAQDLIKNYIEQMGKITGINYKIKWKYEDGGTSVESASSSDA